MPWSTIMKDGKIFIPSWGFEGFLENFPLDPVFSNPQLISK
jgi:hypothetical protein